MDAGYDLTPPEKTRPCAAESPLRWAGSARSYMSPSSRDPAVKYHDDRSISSSLLALAGFDLTPPEKARPCAAARSPLREASGPRPYMPPLSTPSSRNPVLKSHGDRFIPYRGSETDKDISCYFLTEPRKSAATTTTTLQSPSSQVYQRLLAEKLLNNRSRILNFGNKPRKPDTTLLRADAASIQAKPKCRRIIPQTPERMLSAPDLIDDYCLNLLDWGSSDMLSIALGNTIYLLDASTGSISELATVHDDDGPVCSVSWAPDGRHIAVGLCSSDVQLWDSSSNKLVRTLEGVHLSRVGSLAWRNREVLTSGGMDGKIVNNDMRIRSRAAAQTYRGHTQEVCGLKWSGSGHQLASGGNDNLLHLWDASMASSSAGRRTRWLYRLEDHSAAVKGLAWCPFQSNLLASGGGTDDRCIKFWNTSTGACLNSVDTGSQVSALLWNKNDRELLSSHGFSQNQLTLWKYPSMVKMAELGDTTRVLFMAQSPDACTVASAAADETLRFWNVFGSPDAPPKAAVKTHHTGMFNSYNHIR